MLSNGAMPTILLHNGPKRVYSKQFYCISRQRTTLLHSAKREKVIILVTIFDTSEFRSHAVVGDESAKTSAYYGTRSTHMSTVGRIHVGK